MIVTNSVRLINLLLVVIVYNVFQLRGYSGGISLLFTLFILLMWFIINHPDHWNKINKIRFKRK